MKTSLTHRFLPVIVSGIILIFASPVFVTVCDKFSALWCILMHLGQKTMMR